MTSRGGHLVASRRHILTDGDYQISKGGIFYLLKGAVKTVVHGTDEEGNPVEPLEGLTTKVNKNRWVRIDYMNRWDTRIHRHCLIVQPSPELLECGNVRTPGMLETGEQPYILFRPDANMDLADLESHMRILVMESVG